MSDYEPTEKEIEDDMKRNSDENDVNKDYAESDGTHTTENP